MRYLFVILLFISFNIEAQNRISITRGLQKCFEVDLVTPKEDCFTITNSNGEQVYTSQAELTDYGLVWNGGGWEVDSTKFATAYDIATAGGGDDWGSQVVEILYGLIGDGTTGNELEVDTSEIATQYDLTLISGGSAHVIKDDDESFTPRSGLAFLSSGTIEPIGTDDAGGNETEIVHSVITGSIGDNELGTGINTNQLADGTVSSAEFQFINSVTSDVQGQINAIVPNATHAGEVTGATVLTVDETAITNKSLVTPALGDHVLISDSDDSDNLKKVTVQSIVDLSPLAAYTISPSTITSDQDNYAPTGIGKATYLRISFNSGMRAITGIADSTAGVLRKTIFNISSFMGYLPMDHPDSDAAHRFTGWPNDYKLFPGQSVDIIYDITSTKWRLNNSYQITDGDGVHYEYNAGSITAGDINEMGLLAISTGSIAATASTGSTPASSTLATGGGSGGGEAIYFSKSSLTFAATTLSYIYAEAYLTVNTVSSAGETFTSELQITQDPTNTALEVNNTVGIRYSHGINSGKWELFSQDAAGSESVTDLGITVAAGTKYRLNIELDKTGSEARAYIDGAFKGRVNTTMPSGVACGTRIIHLKSVGTTSRLLSIHRFASGAIYP